MKSSFCSPYVNMLLFTICIRAWLAPVTCLPLFYFATAKILKGRYQDVYRHLHQFNTFKYNEKLRDR